MLVLGSHYATESFEKDVLLRGLAVGAKSCSAAARASAESTATRFGNVERCTDPLARRIRCCILGSWWLFVRAGESSWLMLLMLLMLLLPAAAEISDGFTLIDGTVKPQAERAGSESLHG